MRLRARTIGFFLAALVLCLVIPFRPSFAQDAAPAPSPAAVTGPATSTPEPESQLCTVAGTVTSLATGEPLKNVEVVLSPVSAPEVHRKLETAITDANGHFSFEHVSPGRYLMSVSRDGYLPQQYGQQNGEGSGAVLSLAAGEKMTDLIYRLQKTAVISGRVIDEDGEPIMRATVDVLRRRTVNGSVKFESEGSQSTDDLGMYRVFGLQPGKYFVRVSPSGREGSFTVVRGDEDAGEESLPPPKNEYPETYYPGTTDAARASAIDVNAGDEIPRVDFFITPREATKKYRIRGHVTNAISSQSGGALAVMAIPRNAEDSDTFGRYTSQPDRKTGNFTIENVPPGSYAIAAMTFDGGKIRTAMQQVEVINADLDSVSLVLTRGVDISGRVTFDGQAAARGENVTVELQPRNRDIPFGLPSETAVKADGSFSLNEIGDGAYSIRISSKCQECYLKSATSNGLDLLAQGVTISSGSAPTSIDLVYSSNTGKASGTVTGGDDLPVPGAYVVLVTDDKSRDKDDAPPSATTDQYGKFEIIGIPPGRYKAVALQKFDSETANDPDFLKPLAAKADSFGVSAGATATVQLKVVAPAGPNATN